MKALVILTMLSICSPVLAGEIADLQQRIPPDKRRTSVLPPPSASTHYSHGITEVGIERTGCFGTCPAYTCIAKVDGSVRYKGGEYAPRQGEFTSEIHGPYFHGLAQFIKDSGFMDLEDAYRVEITDLPTVYTMVVMNGERKIVRNYGNSGPSKLWAIEALIDDLCAQADWKQKPARLTLRR